MGGGRLCDGKCMEFTSSCSRYTAHAHSDAHMFGYTNKRPCINACIVSIKQTQSQAAFVDTCVQRQSRKNVMLEW